MKLHTGWNLSITFEQLQNAHALTYYILDIYMLNGELKLS